MKSLNIVRTFDALPNTKLMDLEDLVSKLESNMLLDKDRESPKDSRQVALASKGEKSKNSKDKDSSDKDKGRSAVKDKEGDDLALLTQALKIAKERSGKGKEPGKSRRTATKDDECFYCKKKGHFQRDCRKKKADEAREGKDQKDQKSKEDKSKDTKAMFAWGSSETDSDLESDSRFQNLEKDDFCLMAGKEPANETEVTSSSVSSSSSNNMSCFELLDIIKKLCDKNDELKDLIAERDARIGKIREESNVKSIEIRKLKKELTIVRKPATPRQVQEPVRRTEEL